MKIIKNIAFLLLFTGFLIILFAGLGWLINPKTDVIKLNRMKLKMQYGVPEDWLTLCNPAETDPIDENCSQWIHLK